MSSVNDLIVREYLEGLGFLVVQPRKYLPAGRVRIPEEEMDLLAYHPRARDAASSGSMLWTGAELRRCPRVLLGVRGWHTERFSSSLIEGSPEICRFASEEIKARAERLLGGPVVCVLCVPALPASAALEASALELLRTRGISGVLPFRTILLELAGQVDTHRNYDRSDLLQTLRILKAHGLLRGAQLPLFEGHRPRRRKSGAARDGAEA